MNRTQYLLLAAGAVAVILIYQLPRVVVENETVSDIQDHEFSITETDAQAMGYLRQSLEESSENYVNFADSLARLYLKYGFVDSAYNVARQSLQRDSSFFNLKRTSEIFYAVFERSGSSETAVGIGRTQRIVFEKILHEDPDDLQTKTRLAMTLVMTESPMTGINLLREVVATDSTFREAVLNLGLLSIQSGQFAAGEQRFLSLLSQNPDDYEVMLYLAICQREVGKEEGAKKLLESIVEAGDADVALQTTAMEYLKEN